MKLTNDTDYDTRTLRSLIEAVHTAEARGGRRRRLRTWKWLQLRVKYRRKGDRKYTGHAFTHGRKAVLSVPRGGLHVRLFAELWRHELWHLYGILHDDMPDSILYCRITEWSQQFEDRFGMTLDPKVEAPPTLDARKAAKLAKVEQEIARADARVKSWGTKLKRAKTGLKKAERDAKRAREKLARWEEKPVEAFERKAARPKVPEPVPEGHVRVEMTLRADVGDELRYQVEMAGPLYKERSQERQEAWARITAALDPFLSKKARGGKLRADLRPEDIRELVKGLDAPVSEDVGWDRWQRFLDSLDRVARAAGRTLRN